jgi:hypothetical protein
MWRPGQSLSNELSADGAEAVEFTLLAMREEVAEAVQFMMDRGDRNIHYIDGLELIDPELAGWLPRRAPS